MKVLFIGNSHTYVHYVPLRVANFCASQGKKIDAVMMTHPGMGLDWHLQQFPTYFNLMCGDYDAVVLQHNAHPFPGKDSLLQAGEAMAALVPEKTKIYLYMTWSEKNNRQGQEVMTEAYEILAKKIDATICPVGKIWWKVSDRHPEENLYYTDGEHTSVLGASLAASVIGRTLLEMEVNPESCYEDAKELEKIVLDPRMIDVAAPEEKNVE